MQSISVAQEYRLLAEILYIAKLNKGTEILWCISSHYPLGCLLLTHYIIPQKKHCLILRAFSFSFPFSNSIFTSTPLQLYMVLLYELVSSFVASHPRKGPLSKQISCIPLKAKNLLPPQDLFISVYPPPQYNGSLLLHSLTLSQAKNWCGASGTRPIKDYWSIGGLITNSNHTCETHSSRSLNKVRIHFFMVNYPIILGSPSLPCAAARVGFLSRCSLLGT